MVNNSTNINKTKNHLSSQTILKTKNDHGILSFILVQQLAFDSTTQFNMLQFLIIISNIVDEFKILLFFNYFKLISVHSRFLFKYWGLYLTIGRTKVSLIIVYCISTTGLNSKLYEVLSLLKLR
jgi:hypothetical protein